MDASHVSSTDARSGGDRGHASAASPFAALVASVDSSPVVVAQRVRLGQLFGDAANLGPAENQRAPTGTTTALPQPLRRGLEAESGLSLRHVRVHHNSPAPQRLEALAYAAGSDIHLAPGQGRHLPHEAWHVVQQAQGRVQPTQRSSIGVPMNDDARLEHEASTMGARAMAIGASASVPGTAPATSAVAPAPATVQRVKGKGRGRRQKKKLEEREEAGVVMETLPGRAERRRLAQEADLQEIVRSVGRREGYLAHEKRVKRAETNLKTQTARHAEQTGKRTRRQEARAEALAEQRSESDAMARRRQKSLDEAEAESVQREIEEAQASGKAAATKKATPTPVTVAPILSAEDQFAAQFPGAVRIGPMDGIKKVLDAHPNGHQFSDNQNFISSAFKLPSPTLTRFEGQTVYHDTQGGGGGGFTIFGVKVGNDRFLIAHGHHKGKGYEVDWSCVPDTHRWAAGADVGYGVV
jgi:hypothetical protein